MQRNTRSKLWHNNGIAGTSDGERTFNYIPPWTPLEDAVSRLCSFQSVEQPFFMKHHKHFWELAPAIFITLIVLSAT